MPAVRQLASPANNLGWRPAIEHPTKFELVVNLKTAKALCITIPESILLRADEVAELEGARGPDGSVVAPTRSLVFFILIKDRDRWLISSIRGAPISAIQSLKE
jgi:hypothetical protein